MGQLVLCGLWGFGVCFGVICLTLKAIHRYKLVGRAGEFHHTHRAPISRLGGIALAGAFVCAKIPLLFLGYSFTPERIAITVTALAMFGLGLWDDFQPLGARRKLCGQVLIATAACFMGLGIFQLKIPFTDQVIQLGLWSWPVTVLWIVGMTNLINLIDGLDGLAGGICLILMVLLLVETGAANIVSSTAVVVTGALLAFLIFNFPPAKIYMGDGGAYFLGCLIGLLTIASSRKGTVMAALIAPLFVLALPILDTSLAILRRGLRGLPLFRADQGHLHHKLLDSGLPRRTVVLGFYFITLLFLAVGLIVVLGRGEYLPLALGGCVLAVLLAAGRLNFTREWFAVGRALGNSLNMRAKIQYALAQTDWLPMEGARCENLAGLCEDAVFVARKLGFSSVRIQLQDGERRWRIRPVTGPVERQYQRMLPGHPGCFIELGVGCRKDANGDSVPREFNIMSDLIAERWAKALSAWEKQSRLPARFDAEEPLSAEPLSETAEILKAF